MVDLSSEMEALLQALGPPGGRGGKVVQFVSAKAGEGASTVAREFAHAAAAAGGKKGVWLVELDLLRGGQYAAIADDPERYGFLSEATHASPNGSMFFKVEPPMRGVDGRPWANARYMAAHAVGGQRFWVTRFRREALRKGQAVQILSKPEYWDALRGFSDYVIVDAPSAELSRAALATARHMDTNVLVVAADNTDAAAPVHLRDAVERAGGRCAGVVFNRAPAEPPAFLRALLP